jgi:hypothetical protein
LHTVRAHAAPVHGAPVHGVPAWPLSNCVLLGLASIELDIPLLRTFE